MKGSGEKESKVRLGEFPGYLVVGALSEISEIEPVCRMQSSESLILPR